MRINIQDRATDRSKVTFVPVLLFPPPILPPRPPEWIHEKMTITETTINPPIWQTGYQGESCDQEILETDLKNEQQQKYGVIYPPSWFETVTFVRRFGISIRLGQRRGWRGIIWLRDTRGRGLGEGAVGWGCW